MAQELVACEICSTHNYSQFLSTSGYDTPYKLVRCNECGLVFMNPRPVYHLVREYYKEEYFQQQLGSNRPPTTYLVNNLRLDHQRLKFILEHTDTLNNKGILDVGCGCGTFLKLIVEQHPLARYNGVEPNKYFSLYAKEEYGLNIQTNGLEDFNTNESFNFITFWQVINMVPNPSKLLVHMKNFLKPGGTIFIEIPNYLQAPKLPWKKRVYPQDPGQFYYFNKDNLTRLLNKNGFAIKKFKYIENRSWMIISAEKW